ncbi:MAG: patatin-like phospholipase family protein [Gammaproteobacteria bacterium]|nr:patatin-like phospholipase family protein [Gammaproteobacteria bacterium]MCH9743435.1 patatin-like phospholipase family protein [Gammaproteobacteria bacterium]
MRYKHLTKLLTITCAALLLVACAGTPPNIFIPKVAPKPMPPRHNPVRVAVVLGAGGARGYAHLGALSVLKKAGVPIDLVVGASAGSVMGALYSDNGSVAQATKTMMSAGFWDLADIGNFFSFKGIIEGYHIEKFLLAHMRSHTFRQMKVKFIAVTTNLRNGAVVPIESGPVPPAVVASAAMPGAVRPVHLYGKVLVDGGMVDPVPVDVAQKFHPKMIIAVNINKQISHDIPFDAFGIHEKGYAYSWWKLAIFSERGANVVIRPLVGRVGTFDMDAKWQMYQDGVIAAKKALPQILKLMKQKHIARVQ